MTTPKQPNIVAIGGGEEARLAGVKRALELSGEPANALIIPSAATRQETFDSKTGLYRELFDSLGVNSRVLHNFGETPSPAKIEDEIGNASLLYTFGGYTPGMIKLMHEHGTDEAIREAILKYGKVHAGLSAGALLPFKLAHTNNVKNAAEEEWDFALLKPHVDAINAVGTAHADQHDATPHGPRPDSRLQALARDFPTEVDRGFGVDNGATAIFGEHAEIIRSTPGADVHFLSRGKDGNLTVRPAEPEDLKA